MPWVLKALAAFCLFGERQDLESYMQRSYEWGVAHNRVLACGARTLVMGILNITPDSFSDGGKFFSTEFAVKQAEAMIAEGADIIDIGGESTRPGASSVSVDEELRRVVPVIEQLAKTTAVPISIDTTKAAVADAALRAGAEIVNDISGLRFDAKVADAAAAHHAGLVLMHSRGRPDNMHGLPPVENIFDEVAGGLRESIKLALRRGVLPEAIALDPGIGFGKTVNQNIDLLAKLDELVNQFPEYPLLIGTSRKSFIGLLLNDAPAEERVHGTMATVTAAALRGACIVRAHDVRATIETLRVADRIREAQNSIKN